jgi:uncharacterized protein YqhQ
MCNKKQSAQTKKLPRTPSIGGQALIEGIMMKSPVKTCMAVRRKDGTVYTETSDAAIKKWYNKTPFVRGVFNFIEQLAEGFGYLNKSAQISGMTDDDETDEEPGRFEKWLTEKLGDKLTGVITALAMFLGVGLSLLLFMFVPTWIFSGINILSGENLTPFRSLFEGAVKIAVFAGYLWLTSLMKDIRRTYEYHGAEHKTIAAYEAGTELTPENVKKYTRFHPRCGTSFIFLSLAVSILVYSVLPLNSELFTAAFGISQFAADFLRVICKIILLPVIIGVSYELIKFAGNHNNLLTRVISAPGLALQRLTTREPDSEQIEVAICAVRQVINENE